MRVTVKENAKEDPKESPKICRGCGKNSPSLNLAGICPSCEPYTGTFEGRRELRKITGYDNRRRKHHFPREVEGCKSEGDLS